MERGLKHPEWLQIKDGDILSYGYTQEWFHTDWQRLAGCGPTTAAQMLQYIYFKEGLDDPEVYKDRDSVLPRMEEVWKYVTPRTGGGLYKTRWMAEGLTKYSEEKGWAYTVNMLRVYPFAVMRPKKEEVVQFLKAAMEEDVPVAFLNRHRGEEEGLDTWHWVPIVGCDWKEDPIVYVYDDRKIREFRLYRWLERTIFGGGFVYLAKSKEK